MASFKNSSKLAEKTVNIASEEDFPTLGVPKPIGVSLPKSNKGFIQMAEEWGKEIKEDEIANIRRIANDENERKIKAKEKKHKVIPKVKGMIIPKKKNEYYDETTKTYKPIVEDDISDDSFESGPSNQEEEEEEEIIDEEYNTNIGNDGRRRYDLY